MVRTISRSRYGRLGTKYVGLRSSTSSELSWSLTTLNGPAPTGVALTLSSPIVCSAVGEAIQFTLDTTNELITAALACLNLSTTVSVPSVVMASWSASCQRGRQVQVDLTS